MRCADRERKPKRNWFSDVFGKLSQELFVDDNVEDDTIVRYISELLQKERDANDESGEYGIAEDIGEYNPVDDFIEYDKSDGYAEGEEE